MPVFGVTNFSNAFQRATGVLYGRGKALIITGVEEELEPVLTCGRSKLA